MLFVLPLQWDLPGVFIHNSEKSVNGSLWTLTLEGRLYILLALLHMLFFFRKKIILAVVFFMLLLLSPWFNDLFGSVSVLPFYFSLYFFAGVVATLYKEKLRYNKWLFLMALSIVILRCFTGIVNPLTFIAFPYIILYFAQLPSVLKSLREIWRFLVWNVPLFLSHTTMYCAALRTEPFQCFWMIFLSMILTLPFAILSWKWIESRALKAKNLAK